MRPTVGRVLVLLVIAVLVATAVLTVRANDAAASAADRFSVAKAQLDAAIQQAQANGYTDQDLASVTGREDQIVAAQPPVIPELRQSWYDTQVQQLQNLKADLGVEEETALDDSRAGASAAIQLAADLLSEDDRLGVDPTQLGPLEARLAAVSAKEKGARLPRDFWTLKSQADTIRSEADRLATAQAAENRLLAAQAKQLEIQAGGRADVLRHEAAGPAARGRNQASVASYLGISAVTGEYQQFEHYAGLTQSPRPDEVALGLAGILHYADLINRTYLAHLPHKTIVVSLQAQELWAYQDGRQVLDSLVTSGRPQLPTDVGPMHVLFKSSPWTMKSPWPKTSPWWYPDTVVQMAIFFTDTGESLHDASWEPDGYYGPGSQYTGVASHGCIHVPYENERFLYGWVDVGTPVVVYPGDGSPVKNQMAQISVDASGEPYTGPKGV